MLFILPYIFDLLKLAKYLFENSVQAFSLIAIRNGAFPLAWVGEIPYVSTNGGEKGGRLA